MNTVWSMAERPTKRRRFAQEDPLSDVPKTLPSADYNTLSTICKFLTAPERFRLHVCRALTDALTHRVEWHTLHVGLRTLEIPLQTMSPHLLSVVDVALPISLAPHGTYSGIFSLPNLRSLRVNFTGHSTEGQLRPFCLNQSYLSDLCITANHARDLPRIRLGPNLPLKRLYLSRVFANGLHVDRPYLEHLVMDCVRQSYDDFDFDLGVMPNLRTLEYTASHGWMSTRNLPDLSKMKALQKLHWIGHPAADADINSPAGLLNLTHLTLGHVRVNFDISTLQKLQELDLRQGSYPTVRCSSPMPSVKRVTFSHANIRDNCFLYQFPNVTYLYIRECELDTLSGIDTCRSLYSVAVLHAYCNSLDVSALGACQKLEYAWFNNCRVLRHEALARCSLLRTVHFVNCKVTTSTALKNSHIEVCYYGQKSFDF